MKLVSTEDTLVIVTADHAHTMSIGGYTGRFHDITGVVEDPMGFENDAADGDSLTILSYGMKSRVLEVISASPCCRERARVQEAEHHGTRGLDLYTEIPPLTWPGSRLLLPPALRPAHQV